MFIYCYLQFLKFASTLHASSPLWMLCHPHLSLVKSSSHLSVFLEFPRWVKDFLSYVPEWHKWIYCSSDLTALFLPPPTHGVGRWDFFPFIIENFIVSAFWSIFSHWFISCLHLQSLSFRSSLSSLHTAPFSFCFLSTQNPFSLLSWWFSLPGMPVPGLSKGRLILIALGLTSALTWWETSSRIAAAIVASSHYSLSWHPVHILLNTIHMNGSQLFV